MTSLNSNSFPYFDSNGVYQYGTLNSGDCAFMIACTALALFTTIPGLAMYYSGMVEDKDIVACAFQVITITSVITFLWLAFGYSLAFAPASSNGHVNEVYGNADRMWLRGMMIKSSHMMAPTIPEAIFCAYQLCFAIVTAGLICGSFASRLKYHSMVILISFWFLIVYCPIAHSIWHPQGWLYKKGVLDYAGGNVVHICSGMSGLAIALVIGAESSLENKHKPHNVIFTFMGISMMWVGCYGFNAGSAYGANANAAYSLLATQIAPSISAIMWMLIDWAIYKTPSILSIISGAIAGIICISPAAGFIDMTGAFFIGLFGGPLCFLAAQLKRYLSFDDALDGFGVHAIGGIIGGIAVAFFVTDQVQPLGFGERLGKPLNGVYYSGLHTGGRQLAIQLVGVLFTIGWSFIWTFCIAQIIDKTIGLKKRKPMKVKMWMKTIGRSTKLKKETAQRLETNESEDVEESKWTINETEKRDSATIGVNEDDII